VHSLEKIFLLEEERKLTLPEIYKQFYLDCLDKRPEDLVGTDLINDDHNLTAAAHDLLTECGVDDFLTEKDFVFIMHQGYMFWYFDASGDPDPQVFGFSEVKNARGSFGKLSEFIRSIH
jgi:hypothetical protein